MSTDGRDDEAIVACSDGRRVEELGALEPRSRDAALQLLRCPAAHEELVLVRDRPREPLRHAQRPLRRVERRARGERQDAAVDVDRPLDLRLGGVAPCRRLPVAPAGPPGAEASRWYAGAGGGWRGRGIAYPPVATSLPGLRIPAGSRTSLAARRASTPSVPISSGSHGAWSRPIAWWWVIVPP